MSAATATTDDTAGATANVSGLNRAKSTMCLGISSYHFISNPLDESLIVV